MKNIQRKRLKRIIIAGSITLALTVTVKILILLPKISKDHDFANYYCSSRVYIEHQNPYVVPLQPLYEFYEFDLSFKHFELNRVTNPPLLLLLFSPLVLLPPSYAFAIWFLIEIASLVCILAIVKALLKDRISRTGFVVICALTIGSGPVCNNFLVSQVQLLLGAFVLAAYAFLRSGRAVASCIAVTLAGLIKLYPACLVPWFIWHNGKSNKERLKLTIICTVFAVIMLGLSGFDTWIYFFQYTPDSFKPWIAARSANYSMSSFVINSIFSLFNFNPPPPLAKTTWVFASFGAVAVLFVVYLLLWYNRHSDKKDVRETEFALVCTTMLATSLITWESYFVLLIFPFIITFLKLQESFTNMRFWGMIIVWVGLNNLTHFITHFVSKPIFVKVLISYIPFYSLIALGAFILKDMKQKM